MDTFSEFLSENFQRRYPFVEGSSLLGSGDFLLPDSVVLDVRGFSRERPDIQPQLAAVIGPSGSSVLGQTATSGCYSVFFVMGRAEAPMYFAAIVPQNNLTWPFVTEVIIQDSNYPTRDVRLAALRISIGAGVISLDSSISVSFNGAAPLEPALVASLYRTQVDFIKLIHQEGSPDFIGGAVTVVGGYNMDILVLDDGLQLNASLGGGTLGEFTGTVTSPDDSACSGRITSINRVPPNSNGLFTITGENGITEEDVPDQNKILLTVTPQSLGGNLCG